MRLEGETLHTRLAVTNTGDKPFDFTASLHRRGEGATPLAAAASHLGAVWGSPPGASLHRRGSVLG